MATKDHCLPEKSNIIIDKISKDQYSNLNLNQNHQHSKISFIQSKSVTTNDNKKILECVHPGRTQESHSWNKSNEHSSSSYLNVNIDSKEKEKFQKPKINYNNGTLSLHITAYENSIEATKDAENQHKDENSGLVKRKNDIKQLFTSSSSAIQNPFEYPRQQRNEAMKPEIMQYKASQRLLNPNAAISRIEISQFYNSLSSKQRQFFEKYQKEYERLEKELLQTQILLQKEKMKLPENLLNADESRDSLEENLQNDLVSNDIDINSKIPSGTKLSNKMFYDLLKLITQRHQRRQKILEFFGLEDRASDLTLLPPKYLDFFEQKFIQSRSTAVKKNKLMDFEKETVIFPNDKLPLEKETKSLENSSTTVTGASPSDDAEKYVDDSDIPVLEAMEIDITEPFAKKGRFFISPSVVDAACQTDLRLKHILELETAKTTLKNLKDKIFYYKKKSESLKEGNKDYETIIADLEKECDELLDKCDELKELRNENNKINEQIRERDVMILELNDQLENQKHGNKYFLKNKSGKFTVDAHTCFSRLISQGSVAQDKVAIVILILADLFKISIDAVPSRWTVGRDIHMIQALNCEYISKLISECSNLSYLSDETTKLTKKLQASALTGRNDKTNQNFVIIINVSEVPTKSAERCLQEFKQSLSNIGKLSGLNVEKFMNTVFISIRNLMGDQAATTKLLYSLFIAFRSFCLENSDFDDTTKALLKRVNTFFCMLHIISNTSAIVFEALLDHEKFCTNNEEVTEATVLWVIIETARAFSKRSSGKHRTAGQWESLAKEMELKFSKIDSHSGHRFIIRFIIAAEILYNRKEIIGFLNHLGNTDENLLNLKAALNNDMIILHLHILALLGSLILQPMWQLCAASESVLQMTLYAPALIKYLKELIEDPMLLFTANSPFNAFPAAASKEKSKAAEFLKSLKEREIPVGGSEVVPMVAKVLLEYFEKQLEPFITGIYASPDIALERETAGAPLTNMACEATFGFIDRLFTTKPNMTTYNRSALTLAAMNGLFINIAKMPENEQREMYLKAFNNKRLSAELAAEKSQQIHRENIQKIEQEALKQHLEKQKKELKRKKVARELRECGFWLSVEEMDEALQNVPTTTAIKYIKSNIRFRKTVWSPTFEPKHLLQFSYKKHTFTYPELVANLKAVIVADFSVDDPDITSDSDEEN